MTASLRREQLDAATRKLGVTGEEFAEVAELYLRKWNAAKEPIQEYSGNTVAPPPFSEEDVYRLLRAAVDERGYEDAGKVVVLNPAHKDVVASWYPEWRYAWTMVDQDDVIHKSAFGWHESWLGWNPARKIWRAGVLNAFGYILYVADPDCPADRVQLWGENEAIEGSSHREFVFEETP